MWKCVDKYKQYKNRAKGVNVSKRRHANILVLQHLKPLQQRRCLAINLCYFNGMFSFYIKPSLFRWSYTNVLFLWMRLRLWVGWVLEMSNSLLASNTATCAWLLFGLPDAFYKPEYRNLIKVNITNLQQQQKSDILRFTTRIFEISKALFFLC